jgi:hypothetical protein
MMLSWSTQVLRLPQRFYFAASFRTFASMAVRSWRHQAVVAAMHNYADHGITQMAGELIGGCAANR